MLNELRKNIVNTIASRHVVGSGLEDALPICLWANRMGFRTILSPWAWPGDDSQIMTQRYKTAFESLQNKDFDCYVSVKLDAIRYDLGLFKELVEAARSAKTRLHVDSLDPGSADMAFDFIEKGKQWHQDLGCTIPSRWQRSIDDVERALDLGLSVRIVKGQWADPGHGRVDCKINYLAIAEKLAGKARHVGVATHDVPLAKKALACLTSASTYCEMEQLATLPLNGMKIAKRYGYAYRLYVGYGHPGVPYNIRFVLSRPSMVAWIIADFAFNLRKPWSGVIA
jgi:proline dehydrogenase